MGAPELKVENGKLIREIPSDRLDDIIDSCTTQIARLDARKVKIQGRINKARSLKDQLGIGEVIP